MSEALTQTIDPADDTALREDLRAARARLEALVGELRTADAEFERLQTDRERYRALEAACDALEALDTMEAGELFWSGLIPSPSPGDRSEDHLRRARGRVSEYEKQLLEAEDRRYAILEEIELQELSTDRIAGDILDVEREAALRETEWVVEREDAPIHRGPSTMPWIRGGEDDRRFRKTLGICLSLALLLGWLLPLIDIPIPERWQILEEQDRLTRLIREELPAPPPPVVEPQTLTAESEPEPTEPAAETPEAVEELVAESAPAAEPAPKPSAASKGILAFREKFTGLTETDAVDRLGANARIANPGHVAEGLPQRSMVTSKASSSSGGINIAALSRDTGGTGQTLSGVAVTRATSTIGTGSGSDRPLSGGGPGLGRTDEEIQIVFDRHKAALYRLYNRELRKDPTLKGQIVLRLTIEPDGSVSLCEVKSSNMKVPKLGDQVARRVKTFDFGAKDGIPAVTIVYPIDFLPAT